ncbi:hypothetical protein BDN72DRAFT_429547 [Pluteus cervinus]|uniref:Uncharacterized protein n=1 Tax=Pluteus cervinus TaxID=181527 RepID=A0ACD3A896_9AGAR|nr:hypothetical protein BDN72DRAFT_429547 [Pluteus cervinus]
MASTTLISVLPPEILGEIFYHCSLAAADAPLVLAAVSKSFRQTVFTTPRAWRRLRLLLSTQGEAESLRKAKLWLTFAGSCTLDVYLDLTCPETPFTPCLTVPRITGGGAVPAAPLPVSFTLVHEFLRQSNQRLRSLALRTTTQADAQSFLQSIYSSGQDQLREDHMTFPLYKLTMHIVSDSARAQVIPQSPFTLPELPHLSSIRLTNANLPFLPSSNLHNITNLTIIRPLRAQPLPAYAISGLLRSTPRLSYFKLDTRIAPLAFAPVVPRTSDDQDGEVSEDDNDQRSGLITLPLLTHLILRANNLPLLLDHLVVPDLSHLSLSDFDSKRPNASYETANALREILVRMDLPVDETPYIVDVIGVVPAHDCERCVEADHQSTQYKTNPHFGPRGVGGLHTLDLENVSLGRPGTAGKDEDELWEWCFRRMKALRSVKAMGMDMDKLFHLLALRGEEVGDENCPGLERVIVASTPSHSSLVQLQKTNPKLRLDVVSSDMGVPVEFDLLTAITPALGLASEEDSLASSPLPRTPLSAGFVGGFGFGSSFDRARKRSMGL